MGWRISRLAAFVLRCVLAVLAATPAGCPARADDVADFYRANPITIVVGYAPGGGYDQAARVLAKHYGKAIPGAPKIIVRNMPGAGTIVAANHVNNTAPRDGSVIGLYADMLPLAPLLEMKGVQFDPRQFGWIGALASRGTPVLVVRTDAPAKTLDEARVTELLIGASGTGDATATYALLLNDVLGLKLKVLSGYRGGTSEIDLALERGEIHGRASKDWDTLKRQDWLPKGLAHVLLQVALKPAPGLPGVPLAINLARTAQDRQVMEMVLGSNEFFRAFSAPPGVPANRLAALREAFAATMTDSEFIKDFTSGYSAGVTYSTPQQIEAFIARVYGFPPDVIKRAARFVAS
jgi:tripartite-type tricarboxylate transporter receptor subunit TctC